MFRSWARSAGIDDLERTLLDNLSEHHGRIEALTPLDFQDEPETNRITMTHDVLLLDAWAPTPDGGFDYRATLCHATTLLPSIPVTKRKRPLLLADFPMHHVHAEEYHLPADSRLTNA